MNECVFQLNIFLRLPLFYLHSNLILFSNYKSSDRHFARMDQSNGKTAAELTRAQIRLVITQRYITKQAPYLPKSDVVRNTLLNFCRDFSFRFANCP